MVAPSILSILQAGHITLTGKFTRGFNYTFLASVEYQGAVIQAVYKPQEGEQPLWDFPDDTLAHREVAAYLVSEALGWKFVPETIYRREAPFGAGSLQRFIAHNPDYHYFNLQAEDLSRLRPVALFDILVNNADRKGSHLLFDESHNLWLIDHGLCFHVEEKLRTVIWDFAGEPIPEDLRADLKRFLAALQTPSGELAALKDHLSPNEITTLAARAANLITRETYPYPPQRRRAFPYPPI